ncbi:MAG TPA: DUF3667 domain-containing protein [Steroidobacteraceae bacterium]|nr:DUF3667 domain-containing protein [Steroidobacteraceae bacterium]
MSSLPVPVDSPPEPPQPLTLVCANCHSALNGEYCAACGQRHEPHVHTLTHFAGEAFESVSHADSRLWRTLGYLLTRPGYLTREFFAGRRVSYLPPFRLYLVISVLFFLVAGVPKDAEIVRIQAEVKTETQDSSSKPKVAFQIDAPKIPLPVPAAAAGTDAGPDEDGVSAGVRDFCDQFKDQPTSDNDARNNLRDRCRAIASDGGRSLAASIVLNLPRAMFIFLPIIAGVMKLLYWRPKRYYVEHLLFLIHNHAFVFLLLIPLVLVARIPYVGEYAGWLRFAAGLYMVWYIYRGMRNYYVQGRALTLAKYFTLGFAYMITTFIVLLLTAIYSAMMA